MPKITGQITDFGFSALPGHRLRLVFKHSAPGLAGAAIMTTRPVVVTPASNGYFEANLVSTDAIAPAGFYTVAMEWIEPPSRKTYRETFPGKLYVPSAGGVLADILRIPANPALVWTGEEPPANPSPGSWWQKPSGDVYEWAGNVWNYKVNLRGPAGYNALGADQTAATLAAFARGTAGANVFADALREQAGRAVSQLDKSNGTDDTAAINAALAAAAPAAVLRGKPGESYKISAPLVIRTGTTLDMTGCRVTLLPGSNCSMVQNRQVVANDGRDTRISLRGGYWDRGANGGGNIGHSLHTLVFRRVDGLVVENVEVATRAGKYAVNIADATDFRVSNPTFDHVYSDGVHIQGPASHGLIEHVRGTTSDDSVAITGNDYETYADVHGDVTNVTIRDVDTRSDVANLVKVLAGLDCAIDDIDVQKVRGTHGQSAVWIGDDHGHATTSDGTHGRVTVRDVDTEGLHDNGVIYANIRKGIRELLIEDVALRRGLSVNLVQIGTEGLCGLIRVVRPSVDSKTAPAARRLFRVYGNATASIRRLEIDSPVFNSVGGSASMLDSAVAVGVAHVSSVSLTADDTTSTRWVNISGPGITSVTLAAGQITGGRSVFEAAGPGRFALTGGITIGGVNRLMNASAGDVTLSLGEMNLTSALNRLVMLLATAASLTITGTEGTSLPTTANLVERPGTQPVRVNGRRLRTDLALLSGRIGDMVTNANGRGVMPAEHPVIYTGTTWKSMVADLVWP